MAERSEAGWGGNNISSCSRSASACHSLAAPTRSACGRPPSPFGGGMVQVACRCNLQKPPAQEHCTVDVTLIGQHVMNGLMLGVMYGLVAVGFTLFFGVLDVIKFSHGDVLTVGAFTALATWLALKAAQVASPWLQLAAISLAAMMAMALLGAAIAKYLVLPLRAAPALNTLLITLMLGTVLREGVRLIFPDGSNPKPFPRLLPGDAFTWGAFT